MEHRRLLNGPNHRGGPVGGQPDGNRHRPIVVGQPAELPICQLLDGVGTGDPPHRSNESGNVGRRARQRHVDQARFGFWRSDAGQFADLRPRQQTPGECRRARTAVSGTPMSSTPPADRTRPTPPTCGPYPRPPKQRAPPVRPPTAPSQSLRSPYRQHARSLCHSFPREIRFPKEPRADSLSPPPRDGGGSVAHRPRRVVGMLMDCETVGSAPPGTWWRVDLVA